MHSMRGAAALHAWQTASPERRRTPLELRWLHPRLRHDCSDLRTPRQSLYKVQLHYWAEREPQLTELIFVSSADVGDHDERLAQNGLHARRHLGPHLVLGRLDRSLRVGYIREVHRLVEHLRDGLLSERHVLVRRHRAADDSAIGSGRSIAESPSPYLRRLRLRR